MDVDDAAARRDWGFAPRYDFRRAFDEYLIPTIRERYPMRLAPALGVGIVLSARAAALGARRTRTGSR